MMRQHPFIYKNEQSKNRRIPFTLALSVGIQFRVIRLATLTVMSLHGARYSKDTFHWDLMYLLSS